MDRRRFLGKVAGAGAATLAFPYIAPSSWAENNGPALRVALIGVGGIGGRHAGGIAGNGAICPCFAEVDTSRMANATNRWPNARGYQDYRKMFDEMSEEFDAVMVATPDHHHFPATLLALEHGKHCFTEKPLTHSIAEARILNEMATERKLATQMGNQGHANRGNRLMYSWIKGGYIGELVEAHAWTNRPVWPQGMATPEGEDEIPPELDWDVFLGPAPFRPFKRGVYHPFRWRGWWDFGGGALGDMAAHTMDCIYWPIHPRQPTGFEMVKTTGFNGDSFPRQSIIRLTYEAAEDLPAIQITWYSGGLKPDQPEELETDLTASGAMFVGTKATAMSFGEYGEPARIIPEEKMREIGLPEMLVEPSPGHEREWFMACRGERPWDFPKSNFSYSGPFTETTNLGVLAHQLKEGEKAQWDSRNLQVTDRPELNKFVHKPYRKGWGPEDLVQG